MDDVRLKVYPNEPVWSLVGNTTGIKTKELSAKILADNCGQDFDKVMKDFNRDYWMDAEESIKYGIVDSIYKK